VFPSSLTTQLQLFPIAVAGWMNRHQQAVIEYLREENRILLEQLGGKPKRFSDAQRMRLARKAKVIGRHRLGRLTTIVTPDTLLRWFRVLIAKKWTYARTNSLGRPTLDPELEKLVLKPIKENPTWGSNRIVGALGNLGYTLSDSTVDNIRRRHGFDPAPVRGKNTRWRRFLQAHWETLIAADFFTTEVLFWNGLVTFCTRFAIDLRSRLVHVCGTTVSPNADWMKQAARQLVDAVDGFALGKTHLLTDRDTKYCEGFRQILESAGVEIVLCPPRVPQWHADAERFVRSIKEECLSRVVFFSEEHLRSTLTIFVDHYRHRRNHQGIGNKLIEPPESLPEVGRIRCQKHLGGMLNCYYREAV
jgi:transposase InsO family protein